MPNISTIVNVNITLGTQQVNTPGFGTALFLSTTSAFSERYRVYDSIDAVGNDFAPTDPEFLAAELYFGQQLQPTQLMIGRIEGSETVVQAVQAVQNTLGGDNWYGLVLMDHNSAHVLAMAAYIETQKKIFITSSADATIITSGTSDIAYQLKALDYARTAVLYSAVAASFPEAGWFGSVLPLGVGNSTWKFKQIVGIAPDNLSDTQFTFAEGKNCNVFIPIAGVNITSEGTMASGVFIDITRGIDALQATMEADVYSLLVNTPKIPYTNKGITAIENIMRQDLQRFTDNGFLSPDPKYTVSGPDANAVPKSDKMARVLNGLSFTGTLAGAIHKVVIEGFLSF